MPKNLLTLMLLVLLFAGCSDYEQMLEDDYGYLRASALDPTLSAPTAPSESLQWSGPAELTSVVAGTSGCTWLWDGSIGDTKVHSMFDDGRGISGEWYYYSDVAEGGSSQTFWLNDDFVTMISQYHMISGSVVLGTTTSLEAVPSNAPAVTKYDNPIVTLGATGGAMAIMKYPWSMFSQEGWGRRTDITTVLSQLGHLEIRFMGKRGTSSKITVYSIGFLN